MKCVRQRNAVYSVCMSEREITSIGRHIYTDIVFELVDVNRPNPKFQR